LSNKIIGWWSGGVTSAVACNLAIDIFGRKNCRFVFLETLNEHEDTYRFMEDCSSWYQGEIETLSRFEEDDYIEQGITCIQDVWMKFNSLNVASGAICSSELKREMRIRFEKRNKFRHQVFGFDVDEGKRAKALKMNYPKAKPIFPLLLHGLSKKNCISIIEKEGIEIPKAYRLGLRNNNCFKTGCVQGGIGYWKLIQKKFPRRFKKMAKMEHKLTDRKGQPVTICKDQSNKAKKEKRQQVFLLPHSNYPEYKDLSMMQGREVEALIECNGFCGTYDLTPIKNNKCS
jgi:3'-phosphoadenosine 5'-phosphosulfate sulfotransferase (PAPS reductase)/FAD synthetase